MKYYLVHRDWYYHEFDNLYDIFEYVGFIGNIGNNWNDSYIWTHWNYPYKYKTIEKCYITYIVYDEYWRIINTSFLKEEYKKFKKIQFHYLPDYKKIKRHYYKRKKQSSWKDKKIRKQWMKHIFKKNRQR